MKKPQFQLSKIEAGTANIDGFAAREGRSKRHVNGDFTGFPIT
jgi:hypothetical protein